MQDNKVKIKSGMEGFPFMDEKLMFKERASDLVSRMTLEEKLTQLNANTAGAIPRLGIPEYKWWSEALHGVSRIVDDPETYPQYNGKQPATSFPLSLSSGSTWNRELVHKMATIISDEGRSYANEVNSRYLALSFWSPTINLARDPRWGRSEESFSEDPFLTSELASEFVGGMQGEDEKYLKVASTLKHFMANNSEYNRHVESSDCDDRTLREYYARAFKDIVKKVSPEVVMTAYNAVNGTPVSVNKYLIDTLLRRTWGFDGHVVTDAFALSNIFRIGQHEWKPEGWVGPFEGKETAAYAMMAGSDLNCGWTYKTFMAESLKVGLVTEDYVDRALVHLFTTRMRTGEFDSPEQVPYSAVNGYTRYEKVRRDVGIKLSEEIANESIVLLKNDTLEGEERPFLPLDKEKVKKVVIIGEQYDRVMLGGYANSWQTLYDGLTVSPLEALNKEGVEVVEIKNPKVDYLKQLQSITFIRNDGSRFTMNAKTANVKESCMIDEQGTIVNIAPHGEAYIGYESIDLTGVTHISVSLKGKNKSRVAVVVNDRNLYSIWEVEADDDTKEYTEYCAPLKPQKNRSFNDKFVVYIRFYDNRQVEEKIVKLTDEYREEIKNADAVLAFIGHQNGMLADCDEENDMKTLRIPRGQDELVNEVASINPKVAVFVQGIQSDVGTYEANVPSIMWSCFNGEQQGTSAMNLIFGRKSPSGRLPFTWYKDETQLPHLGDYAIRTNDMYAKDRLRTTGKYYGRTYWYFKGDVQYAFGHGISYAEFEYKNLRIDKAMVTPNDTISVCVDVLNRSKVDAKEVVQVYVKTPQSISNDRPEKQLRGFKKVKIKAGEMKTVEIELKVAEMYFFDNDHNMVFDQGEYTIEVGHDSKYATDLSTKFVLEGSLIKNVVTVKADPSAYILRDREKEVSINLSAACNDESFVNLQEAACINYSVNKRGVIQLEENTGRFKAVGNGTVMVKASVTYNGSTVSDEFPITVALA